LEQILPELPAALAVAPVAHPDEVERLLEPRHGPEHARVRRLMPGPGAWCVLQPLVTAAQCLPERQHTVVVGKVEGAHLLGRAHDAVVRVVEEELEAAVARAMATELSDHLGRVPLVRNDDVSSL